MENMTQFFSDMLHAVAQFLGTEPVIYVRVGRKSPICAGRKSPIAAELKSPI